MFKLNNAETQLGQRAHVIGAPPQLGAWDPNKSKKLSATGTYPAWKNKDDDVVYVSEEDPNIEYKYFISSEDLDSLTWEDGENRKLNLSQFFDSGDTIVVEDQGFNKLDEKPRIYTTKEMESGPNLTQDFVPEYQLTDNFTES